MGERIRALPHVTASPAFTREVMQKVKRRERPRPLVWRLAAALAMAVCLVAVVQTSLAHRAEQKRFDDLRAEQRKIEAELAAVKQIANDAEPVVVLENEHGTRVVVDLDSAIQPASLRTFD